MRKSIFGSIAFAGLIAGPAIAADMLVKAPIYKAPVVVEYDWTGCYVGGNAGWKWGRFRETADTAPFTGAIPGFGPVAIAADHIDLDGLNTTSGAVGGQIGCRWQTRDHWVLGVEGDADWTDLKGTVRNQRPPAFPFPTRGVFSPGDYFGNRARWESSLRVTAGHSWDRVLVYVTGGVAFTGVTMDGTFIPVTIGGTVFPGSFGSDSKTLVGGTIGGGFAYALGNGFDVGAEYRYSSYQSADFNLGAVQGACVLTTAPGPQPGCLSTTVTGHKRLETSEILFRLNYRFGAAAVVARY